MNEISNSAIHLMTDTYDRHKTFHMTFYHKRLYEAFLIFKKTPPIYRISEIYPKDGWSLLSLTSLIE